MSQQTESLTCPFCDFIDNDSYFLMQHVELIHPENDQSPFVVSDTNIADQGLGRASLEHTDEAGLSNGPNMLPRTSSTDNYIDCPHGCGERILADERQAHQDLHVVESMAFEEHGHPVRRETSVGHCVDQDAREDIANSFSTDLPRSLRNYEQLAPSTPSSSDRRKRISLKDLFLGSPSPKHRTPTSSGSGKTRQLGRSELGPYAREKEMPSWLRKMLEKGPEVTVYNKIGANGAIIRVEAIANETPDLVPVLARLSHLDCSVERAFYCNPAVRHIAKMPREGGFCGYRNIQMMISYICDAQADGNRLFKGKIPSILRLQDMIEQAWDMGFNSIGRIETGGIRLTRKYIGTPEAQALFSSLTIPCDSTAFMRYADMIAYENLLFAVWDYFADEQPSDSKERVTITSKPPIYFQQPGHSMTIVGMELRADDSVNLVVFDPMFNPSPAIKRLVGSHSFRIEDPARLIKAHRRGEYYLSKYKDFEILTLGGNSEKAE